MFRSEIEERFYSNAEVARIPIGYHSNAIRGFCEVLEDILEENPYEQLSALFLSSTDE